MFAVLGARSVFAGSGFDGLSIAAMAATIAANRKDGNEDQQEEEASTHGSWLERRKSVQGIGRPKGGRA
jgi:hypothetical protein